MRDVERLSVDLQGIEIREPQEPVGKDEVVVGEVPESLRALYCFGNLLQEQHRAFHDRLDEGQVATDHADPVVVAEHQAVHAAQMYVGVLITERLHAAVDPLGRFERLGVRQGWVVVGKEAAPRFGIEVIMMGGDPRRRPGLLERLFG